MYWGDAREKIIEAVDKIRLSFIVNSRGMRSVGIDQFFCGCFNGVWVFWGSKESRVLGLIGLECEVVVIG